MTYQEQLKNSEVIKTGIIPKSYFNLLSPKKRLRSLITFLLIALYTILTKIVFKANGFDIIYVVLIVNLISLFILKIISNSIFSLNHINTYNFVFFISRVCKLIIFISVYITSSIYFMEFFKNYYEAIGEPAKKHIEVFGINFDYYNRVLEFEFNFYKSLFQDIANSVNNGAFSFSLVQALIDKYGFSKELIQFASREVSILLFIPVFFYFLSADIKYIFKFIKWTIIILIPIYNLVYYFSWLFYKGKTIINYTDSKDPKYMIKETRLLNEEAQKEHITHVRGVRFLQSVIIFLMYFILFVIIHSSVMVAKQL